jgi:release factor glutamine methyltransferase
MAEKKLTTLLEIIKYSSNLLDDYKIKDARLNVELMFCEILNCDRIKLYLDFDKPLKPDEVARFKSMLKRRIQYEPLQYIIGKTNFYGYKINLNNKVLIPRQETEILVGKLLDDIYESGKENIRILEIGSGSGCIAIALSGEMSKNNIEHKIVSIEKSVDAIEIAKCNAKTNNIPDGCIEFKVEDFFKNSLGEDDFDYIVSNPPYIPVKEIDGLDVEVKSFEPIDALSNGKDGLLFYENIVKLYYKKSKIFVEIGDGQKVRIEDLLKRNNIKDYNFFKDYCNIERVLKIN